MDAKQIISQNLINLLCQHNMSKSELACRLGVSKTSVSNWCLGLLVPRMDKIDAMASVFGVSRSALLVDQSSVKNVDDEPLPRIAYIMHNAQKLNDEGLERLSDYSDVLSSHPNYMKLEMFETFEKEKDPDRSQSKLPKGDCL